MQKIESQIVIGVPIFNEGAYIPEILRSLAMQAHTDFKVLVSDNASIDEAEQICREFCAEDARFTYLRHCLSDLWTKNYSIYEACYA